LKNQNINDNIWYLISVAGPPASDLSDDPYGNRDDPVFIDDNEGAIGSQDCDQNTSKYHNIGYFFF